MNLLKIKQLTADFNRFFVYFSEFSGRKTVKKWQKVVEKNNKEDTEDIDLSKIKCYNT